MPLGTLGKYERIDVLGHGVSGIVYLAKDTLLNKQVALKEVDVQAGDMRRFLEEARVMDRLRHPNIVRVNGVDRIDGKIVIDMEYIRGENLQEILRAEGRLPVDRALDIAAQVLDALDYAHRMQTVHRDVKPANVLIDREGTVKLADFGLAEILATNAYAGGAGTYAYMAPEDFAEEDRSDSQSDIWAVGVTLYEMLAGARPFQVTKVKDPFAWKRVLESERATPIADYISNAPAALQAILDQALNRDKRGRYATAGEFRLDILRIRAGGAPALETTRQFSAPSTRRFAADAGAPEPTIALSADLPVWTGPGTVVADVSAAITQHQKPRFARTRAARVTVEPTSIDFGTIHKGDVGSAKIQARVETGIRGFEGRVQGRVLHAPGWLTVHPTAFQRARQTISLTAHTGRAWETGDFEETVSVETVAGTVDIPVRLRVIPPRRTFSQVALWYIPALAAALMPVLVVAFGGGASTLTASAQRLIPAAVLVTALLATMLLLVCVAADTGTGEKLACFVLMSVMWIVLGAAAHGTSGRAAKDLLTTVIPVGGIAAIPLGFQLFTMAHWRVWAGIVMLLGVIVGGAFLNGLSH